MHVSMKCPLSEKLSMTFKLNQWAREKYALSSQLKITQSWMVSHTVLILLVGVIVIESRELFVISSGWGSNMVIQASYGSEFIVFSYCIVCSYPTIYMVETKLVHHWVSMGLKS